MADEKNTQFNYLLNAVMHAAQEAHPAKAGYAGKYRALIAHVRELERKAALYDAEHKDGVVDARERQIMDDVAEADAKHDAHPTGDKP